MSNRFYALLFVLVGGLFLAWNSIFVVNERQQAVIVRSVRSSAC